MEPLLDVVEGLEISHVIDNDDSVSSSVVTTCDGSKSLLSSSIPLLNKIIAIKKV
jgi:hypothetical protein